MRSWKVAQISHFVAAGLVGIVAATSALAQTSSSSGVFTTAAAAPAEDLLNDRFQFSLGLFVVSSKTNGRLNGAANTSDQSINFDNAFGLDNYGTRWRAEALWRITPRQHLRFSYFDDDVSKTRTFNKDLEWGDYTFLANGAVTAEVRRHVYVLDYEYAFLREHNYEVEVTAGVHFDNLALKLSGDATLTVNGVPQPASFATKNSTVPAPLPTIGIRGDWAVAQNWYLDASLQGFKIKYQAFNGSWVDLNAGVTYMFSDHFGVGVGYELWSTHVDVSKGNFNGRLNFGYQGGLIYIKGGF